MRLVRVGVELPAGVPGPPLVTAGLAPLTQTIADQEDSLVREVEKVVERRVLGRNLGHGHLTAGLPSHWGSPWYHGTNIYLSHGLEGEDLWLSVRPGSSSVDQEQRDLALQWAGPLSSLTTGAGASARALDVAGLTHSLALSQWQPLNIRIFRASNLNLGGRRQFLRAARLSVEDSRPLAVFLQAVTLSQNTIQFLKKISLEIF